MAHEGEVEVETLQGCGLYSEEMGKARSQTRGFRRNGYKAERQYSKWRDERGSPDSTMSRSAVTSGAAQTPQPATWFAPPCSGGPSPRGPRVRWACTGCTSVAAGQAWAEDDTGCSTRPVRRRRRHHHLELQAKGAPGGGGDSRASPRTDCAAEDARSRSSQQRK